MLRDSMRDRANTGWASAVLAVGMLVVSLVLGACACSGEQVASSADGSGESFESVPGDADLPSTPPEPIRFDIEGMDWNPALLADVQAINPDAYAWLYVPGTAVSRAVFQNGDPGDEDYYLGHDAHGNVSGTGELYSQVTYSKRTFNDPVTVIYGHTYETYSGWGEEMFSTLHNFEDPDFFANHRYFYIFTSTKVRRYEVLSAYEYENLHILDSFDFKDKKVLQEYFNYVANPESPVKNVRTGKRLKAGKDHIVQLATCTRPANDDFRYLVTGVLAGEMPI